MAEPLIYKDRSGRYYQVLGVGQHGERAGEGAGGELTFYRSAVDGQCWSCPSEIFYSGEEFERVPEWQQIPHLRLNKGRVDQFGGGDAIKEKLIAAAAPWLFGSHDDRCRTLKAFQQQRYLRLVSDVVRILDAGLAYAPKGTPAFVGVASDAPDPLITQHIQGRLFELRKELEDYSLEFEHGWHAQLVSFTGISPFFYDDGVHYDAKAQTFVDISDLPEDKSPISGESVYEHVFDWASGPILVDTSEGEPSSVEATVGFVLPEHIFFVDLLLEPRAGRSHNRE